MSHHLQTFRLQFLGLPGAYGPTVLDERPIRAADITTAKTMAANTPWYDCARAYRLVDLDGRELYWRARGQ